MDLKEKVNRIEVLPPEVNIMMHLFPPPPPLVILGAHTSAILSWQDFVMSQCLDSWIMARASGILGLVVF